MVNNVTPFTRNSVGPFLVTLYSDSGDIAGNTIASPGGFATIPVVESSGGDYTMNAVVTDESQSISVSTPSILTTVSTLSPTIGASATAVDAGQTIIFTGTAGGGTPAYTYNFTVINTGTSAPFANAIYSNIPSPSDTFAYITQPGDAGKTIAANVTVTDNSVGDPVTENSTRTPMITINSAFVASAAPTATNYVLDNGQSTTLTVSAPTTGTRPTHTSGIQGHRPPALQILRWRGRLPFPTRHRPPQAPTTACRRRTARP